VLIAALRSRFHVTVLTSNAPNTLLRIVAGLGRTVLTRKDYDVVFVGFYGQPLAIALARLQGRPLVLDAYVSTFETLCEDRQIVRSESILGRLAAWLDRRSAQVASQVVTDTVADAQYFHCRFGVPEDKITAIYVGCDDALFFPRSGRQVDDRIDVFYYGSFLPLQGIDTIIKAAAELGHYPRFHFTIGGSGMRYAQIKEMVDRLALVNVDLVGWIPFDELPAYIAQASICLGGHFSKGAKAARVISTKTFQFLAMRKPTIVGANAATAELFEDGRDVLAVPMGDPTALAQAILRLGGDAELCAALADNGYALFQDKLTTEAIAERLAAVLEKALCV